jgi:hypothetical protein
MRIHLLRSALFVALLIGLAQSTALAAPDKTVVRDAKAKAMLVGGHLFSMQWVSWDRFGRATVTEHDGILTLKAEQRYNGEYVTVDGTIVSVDTKEFVFEGKIITRVSHINGGEPCVRDGRFTFAITQNRKYWRLQQMDNPCESVTDYIDVYFRRR